MKVIAYNVNQSDKEHLAQANRKKHQITVIAYPLNESTVCFAEAKDAVVIINQLHALTLEILQKLALYRIKYLVTTSSGSIAVHLSIIQNFGISYQTINSADANSWALALIRILDAWEKK